MENKLPQLFTAKEVAEKKIFPYSASQILKLAQQGKVPCYSVPGLGNRLNWWFSLDELYEFFTKNGGLKRGSHKISQKPKALGSGLARRWT
ncbi:MAG: hypothetical protein ABII18_08325 [bacterium]